jgi:RNA polymerase sigma factor (sigma-70 family)
VVRHHLKGTSGRAAVGAATALFAEHGRFIRAVIRFQAQNEFLEEDLFQEFFLLLVTKPIPTNVFNIKSYLYRAVTHFVVEYRRRQARYARCLDRHAEELRISVHNQASGSALLETEDAELAFRRWTGPLRRREAQAFRLRYRENFSIGEIAQAMGVDRRTVSHYLSAGLKRLRRMHAIE